MRLAFGNARPVINQQLDRGVASARFNDPVTSGIGDFHHIDGQALIGKGYEFRPNTDLQL